MTKKEMIEALDIFLSKPLKLRLQFTRLITYLKAESGDSRDVLSDQRGKHWARARADQAYTHHAQAFTKPRHLSIEEVSEITGFDASGVKEMFSSPAATYEWIDENGENTIRLKRGTA